MESNRRMKSGVRRGAWIALLAAPLAALGFANGARAVAVGQSDDFEDGTQGWTSGATSPAPPIQVATGGPDGADDAWLQIAGSGGSGPGSRVAAVNDAQWTGDYTGASELQVDLQVTSATDLAIRLYLRVDACSVVTEAVPVAAGAGWARVSFGITPEELVNSMEDGCPDIALALANVTRLHVAHSPEPSAASSLPPTAGVLGVDNLTLVPEPGGAGAAWVAAGALAALRSRSAARRRRDARQTTGRRRPGRSSLDRRAV
jgi:hypothetical protein